MHKHFVCNSSIFKRFNTHSKLYCIQAANLPFPLYFVDFNECEANRDSCDENAKCVNTAGSYICFCSPGYFGNGFSCKSKFSPPPPQFCVSFVSCDIPVSLRTSSRTGVGGWLNSLRRSRVA